MSGVDPEMKGFSNCSLGNPARDVLAKGTSGRCVLTYQSALTRQKKCTAKSREKTKTNRKQQQQNFITLLPQSSPELHPGTAMMVSGHFPESSQKVGTTHGTSHTHLSLAGLSHITPLSKTVVSVQKRMEVRSGTGNTTLVHGAGPQGS